MKKITSISIGIPAYNEEANIKNLLESILSQREIGYLIKEIIVISDGSSDSTMQRVNEVKDRRIKLIDSQLRIGKSQHLNNLFKITKEDILVLFDADVVLADKKVIQNLIRPLVRNSRVGLVGGCPYPRKGRSFIERSINASFVPYNFLRYKLKKGNNVYGCDGRILALSKKFFNSIHVPRDMIANDAFMYFECITKGFKFINVKSAKVWFRSPTTLRDYLRQNKRFIAAHYRLEKFFGKIVPKEYQVPKILMYKLLASQFLKAPFQSFSIFTINLFLKYQALKEEKNMTALWPMAFTTKVGVKND